MSAVAPTMSLDRVSELPAISLNDLNEVAALQQRVDRKYIVSEEQLVFMLDALATRLAALEIDDQRSFAYESVYFDTPNLDSYLSAAYRRRNRFKARTRSYLDSKSTMLEVKTRGLRNVTVKSRQEYEFDSRNALVSDSFAFIDSATGRPGLGAQLAPAVTTEYTRTTLVDLDGIDGIARLTIDANLRCTDWKNDQLRLRGRYVVETKSAGRPSAADRWLWSNEIRPSKISKFGTTLAVLNPALPSNVWHRTINRHFGEAPIADGRY